MASRPALVAWFCVAAVGLAACQSRIPAPPGEAGEALPPPEAAVAPAGVEQDMPPPPADTTGPAQEVETLENRLRRLDDDGDGFVDRDEAESFYRWRFAKLDDDGDGRLSRAELELEYADVPEAEVAIEELVGASEDEYAEAELQRFHLRADRTSNMMSTGDFDELLRTGDVGDFRP